MSLGGSLLQAPIATWNRGSGEHVLVLNGFLIGNQASLSWNPYSFQLFFLEGQFYFKFLGKSKQDKWTFLKVCMSFLPVTRRPY